ARAARTVRALCPRPRRTRRPRAGPWSSVSRGTCPLRKGFRLLLAQVLVDRPLDPGTGLGIRDPIAAEELALALEREARDRPGHREAFEEELLPPLPAIVRARRGARLERGELPQRAGRQAISE